MSGIFAGSSSFAPAPCTISGALGASAASNNVTGASRTLTVPNDNSGRIEYRNILLSGTDGLVSFNAAAFASMVGGGPDTRANGDTIQCRATGCFSTGLGIQFDIFDTDTGTLIQGVVLQRS